MGVGVRVREKRQSIESIIRTVCVLIVYFEGHRVC